MIEAYAEPLPVLVVAEPARVARGRPAPAAALVAGHREDVRARSHLAAGRRGAAGLRRVRRLRRRAWPRRAGPSRATTW
nr:hypothetical protein [Angustibacter aerolatus]